MSQLTKEYIAQLDKGVRELFASGRWQDYLAFLSRFHRYSVNNTMPSYQPLVPTLRRWLVTPLTVAWAPAGYGPACL